MSNQPKPVSVKSLLALVIVVLVAAFLIYRGFGGEYARATFQSRFDFHKPPPPGSTTQVDIRPLLTATPQLLTEGKQVFEANCVPCHGPDGYGNGPRAAGLSPPPRNFHQPVFHYGTSVLTMYHTVTNGSPGTSMPSFAALSPEERLAAIHYVRQWIPKNALQPNSAADLAALATPESSAPSALPPLQPVPNGPRIPIAVAMQIVAEEAPTPPPSVVPPSAEPVAAGKAAPAPRAATVVASAADGAALYATHCQSCHGADGQGGTPIMMIDSAPYLELRAQSFRHPLMLTSLSDAAGFDQIVLHGLAGRMMPGFGTLTRPQLNSIYDYVQQLAGDQAAAGAPAAGHAAPAAPHARGGTR